MQFNFVYDCFQNGEHYPNLAGQDCVIKCRLEYYFVDHNYPVQYFHIDEAFPTASFYPIGFSFYNFTYDYFALLPNRVKELVKQRRLQILFYYHEGDNPQRQLDDLAFKCSHNQMPSDCWRFISGNSAANSVDKFLWFADHELFYWKLNKQHRALMLNTDVRVKDFTLLCRTHKWWRATAIADLHRLDVLENSYWSYGNESCDDEFDSNPIEIDSVDGLRNLTIEFVHGAPYSCDNLTSEQHNSHDTLVAEHFNNSYIHIVLETFFDADQSHGTFLTEKTFKPIKHAQPFVIVGPAGSLTALRELGYKTFDDVIDPRYDEILDNTKRWHCVRDLLLSLKNKNLHQILSRCREDIEHNQYLFRSTKFNRIENLYKQLYEKS